jgi:N6-L-threonylcarbamoyladenine synthase/protein kinase Bud32
MTLAKGKRPKMTQKESKVAGAYLSKLHNAGIIHGDYTKANLILTKEGLVVIDFGLGFFSKETEDKAVDVFTMLKSLENGPSRKAFLSGYSSSGNKAVVGQLENIRKRMRYIKA